MTVLNSVETPHRCQSCGMPLEDGFYGTLQGGATMTEYCKFCFQDGNFTEPELTALEMLNRTTAHMETALGFTPEEAMALAQGMIFELRRWKK